MSDRLSSFCVACARFTAGDRLGQLHAVLATAPYFANYHVAVIFHARREVHMAFVLVGLLLTAVLSSAAKKLLRHPRPAATCALLGNCHKPGMPSSHSAVMAFAATTCFLLYRHRQASRAQLEGAAGSAGGSSSGGRDSSKPSSSEPSRSSAAGQGFADSMARALELLEVLLLALLTAAVAYGRVYLGYHTPGQALAGLAVGAGFAAAWCRLTLAACRSSAAAALLRLPPLRALHLRNTLGCPGVHALEAALFADRHTGGAVQLPLRTSKTQQQQQQHID